MLPVALVRKQAWLEDWKVVQLGEEPASLVPDAYGVVQVQRRAPGIPRDGSSGAAMVKTVRLVPPFDSRQSGELQALVDRIAQFRKPLMIKDDDNIATLIDNFPILAKL